MEKEQLSCRGREIPAADLPFAYYHLIELKLEWIKIKRNCLRKNSSQCEKG